MDTSQLSDTSSADLVAIESYLKVHDPPSYFGLRTVNKLKGASVQRHRTDIFRYLTHRYREIPLAAYLDRIRQLRQLQARFEQRNAYDASSYADVQAIEGDTYRIALLLSFVLTNHRFEILQAVEDFCRTVHGGEPEELLSIGFGTGYELKVACQLLPGWRYHAYDASPESVEFAADLLNFFGCSTAGLRTEYFPLEESLLPPEHHGRYGKIVLAELLEHLENPEAALRNMHTALHPRGLMLATMAINIAQEDHLHLYRTKDDARMQVERAGFTVMREFLTPVTVIPFSEKHRESHFSKGNYVCYLSKA